MTAKKSLTAKKSSPQIYPAPRPYLKQIQDALGLLDVDGLAALLAQPAVQQKIVEENPRVAKWLHAATKNINTSDNLRNKSCTIIMQCVRHGIRPMHEQIKQITRSDNISNNWKKEFFTALQDKGMQFNHCTPTTSPLYYIAERSDVKMMDVCGGKLFEMGAKLSYGSSTSTDAIYKTIENYMKDGNPAFYKSIHNHLERNVPDTSAYYKPIVNTMSMLTQQPARGVSFMMDYKRLEKKVLKKATGEKYPQNAPVLFDMLSDYTTVQPDKHQAEFLCAYVRFLQVHQLDQKIHGRVVKKEEAEKELKILHEYRCGENKEGSTHTFSDFTGLMSHSLDITKQFSNHLLYPAIIKVLSTKGIICNARNLSRYEQELKKYSASFLFGRTDKNEPIALSKCVQLVARMERAQDNILKDVSVASDAAWLPLTKDWQSSNGYKIVNLTSYAELKREGKELSHCVGGSGNSCMNGTLRVFSVRKIEQPEKPLYTAGLSIDLQTKKIKQMSRPLGYKNANPPSDVTEAWEAFKNKIDTPVLPVDWQTLHHATNEYAEKQDEQALVDLVGYDINKADATETVYQGYRTALKAANYSRVDAPTYKEFIEQTMISEVIDAIAAKCIPQNSVLSI